MDGPVRFELVNEQIWRLNPARHRTLPITYFTETPYGFFRYAQPGNDFDRRTAETNAKHNGLQYNSYGQPLNRDNYAGNTQILCFRLELTEQENNFRDGEKWFPLSSVINERRMDIDDYKYPTDNYYAFLNNKKPGGGRPMTSKDIMNEWGSNINCYNSFASITRLERNQIFGQDIFTVFDKWITYYKPVAAKAIIEESNNPDLGNLAARAGYALLDNKFIGLSECPWIVLMAYIGGLNPDTEVSLHKFFVFYGAPTENIIVCWALLLAYAFGVKKKGNKLVGPGVILISIVKNNMTQVVQEIKSLVTAGKILDESVVGVLIDGHITLLYVSEEGLGFVELQGLYVRLITYDEDWGRYYSRFTGAPRGAGGYGIISAQLICVENKDNFRERGGGKINGNKKINIKNNNIISKQYGGYDVNYRENRTRGPGWPAKQVIGHIIFPYLENVGMRGQSIYTLFEYINGNDQVVEFLNQHSLIEGQYRSLIEVLGICMNAINGISGDPQPLPNSENSEAYNTGGMIELLSIYGQIGTLTEGFKLFSRAVYNYLFGNTRGEKTVEQYEEEYDQFSRRGYEEYEEEYGQFSRRGIEDIHIIKTNTLAEIFVRYNQQQLDQQQVDQILIEHNNYNGLEKIPSQEEVDTQRFIERHCGVGAGYGARREGTGWSWSETLQGCIERDALQENVMPLGEALSEAMNDGEINFMVDEINVMINNARYLIENRNIDDAVRNIVEALTIYKKILLKRGAWTTAAALRIHRILFQLRLRKWNESEFKQLKKKVVSLLEYVKEIPKMDSYQDNLEEIKELLDMVGPNPKRAPNQYGKMGRRPRRTGGPDGGGRPKKIKKRNNKKKSINKKHKTKIKLSKKRKSIKRKSIKKRKYKKTIKK